MRAWIAALPLTLAVATTIAQTQSQWVGGGTDHNWSTSDNWAPAEVPNNGMDTYDVTTDGASITLDLSPTISSLVLNVMSGVGVGITGSGQSLIVEGLTDVNNGQFLGSGAFMPQGVVDIDGNLYLGGSWMMNANNILLGTGSSNSSVILDDSARIECTGSLEILNDSLIQNFGTTATLLKSSGILLKSGGTGQTSISVPFENNGGTVQATTGTLAFTNTSTLSGGSILALNAAKVRLNNTINASGTIDVRAANTSEVTFNNAVIDAAATFTGGGDPGATIKATGSGTRISQATLDFDPNSAFQIRAGRIGESGQVTNKGYTKLFATTINGAGLKNNTGGEVTFTTGEPGTATIDATTLDNQGTVHQLANVQLKTNGKVTNTGTWRVEGGLSNVNLFSGATNTEFNNTGQVIVELPASTNDAIVHVPFKSPGTILVRNGEYKLDKPQLKDTVIELDPTNPSDPNDVYAAEFSAGLSSLSSGSLENVNFLLTANSKARFLNGTFTIADLIGTSGFGTLTNNALLIANQEARFEGGANAPFVMQGDVQADATVNNDGVLNWASGLLTGTGEFHNRATLNVNGLLAISDNASQGTMVNRAALNFAQAASAILGNTSVLRNDPNGTIAFAGDVTFYQFPNSTNQLLVNTGDIVQTVFGGVEIYTPFKQTAGRTESQAGNLTFFATPIELLGGTLAASAADATIAFDVGSTSSGVDFEFSNDGKVVYQGQFSTHELSGSLYGAGNGRAILRTATMRPKALTQAGFEFSDGAAFRVETGTLGAAAEILKNDGAFEQTGGEVIGLFNNNAASGGDDPMLAGTYTLTGGRLKATFQNNGDFIWRDGGFIEGPFTNNALGDCDMTLEGNDALLLSANTTLTNNGDIVHAAAATLELGENAQLINNASTGVGLIFTNGGNLSVPSTAVTNAKLISTGRVANTSDLNTTIGVIYESTGGTLETIADGDLSLPGVIGNSGPDATINSGRINTAFSKISTSNAALNGTITHNIGASAHVDHTSSIINANLIAEGDGPLNLEGFTTMQGGQCAFTTSGANSQIALKNTCEVFTDASTAGPGLIVFDNTDMILEGDFNIDSNVQLKSDNPVLKIIADAETLGRDFTIAANRTATLIGDTQMILGGDLKLLNNGEFHIVSPTGGIESDGSLGLAREVINAGQFVLDATSTGISIIDTSFTNDGTVTVLAGELVAPVCTNMDVGFLSQQPTLEGGTWEVLNGAQINLGRTGSQAPAPLGTRCEGNNAVVRLSGAGSKIVNFPDGDPNDFTNESSGRIELLDGASISFTGLYENDGVTIVGPGSSLSVGTINNDGALTVNGVLNIADASALPDGCTGGTGTINGSTLTNAACLAPGQSPGMLTINADIINTASSSLQIELAGVTPATEYDLLMINGDLTLDGTLDVTLLDGFVPDPADTFTILDATSMTGAFANAPDMGGGIGTITTPAGDFTVTYAGGVVALTNFTPAPPLPGDCDGDGDVDAADLVTLNACLTGPGIAANPGCECFDLDGDGDADMTDYALLQQLFTTP